MRERQMWQRRACFSCMCDQGGKKKATTDAVSVKQPRCQKKANFEFGFPSSIADFPKEHHSSASNSFLLSTEKKYWLVGKCLQYLFRCKVQENLQSFPGYLNFILNRIAPFLIPQTVTEEPITPALRLAICLYRLGRGDYLYTISEMSGLGLLNLSGSLTASD